VGDEQECGGQVALQVLQQRQGLAHGLAAVEGAGGILEHVLRPAAEAAPGQTRHIGAPQ
jgi:hypothetical protein